MIMKCDKLKNTLNYKPRPLFTANKLYLKLSNELIALKKDWNLRDVDLLWTFSKLQSLFSL